MPRDIDGFNALELEQEIVVMLRLMNKNLVGFRLRDLVVAYLICFERHCPAAKKINNKRRSIVSKTDNKRFFDSVVADEIIKRLRAADCRLRL